MTTQREIADALPGLPGAVNSIGALKNVTPASTVDYTSLQNALTSVSAMATAANAHAEVALSTATVYAINSGITFNTVRVSLSGGQLIDATAIPSGKAAVTVDSTADSPFGNSYGYKATLNVKLKGAGPTSGQIGIDFNGSVTYGSAQVNGENIAMSGFQTGIRFSNRAYNSTLRRLDLSNCGVCVDWPAGGEDNGERNTLESPTLYNSQIAVRASEPSGMIQVFGGSCDFCAQNGVVNGGKIAFNGVHHESNNWDTYAFEAYGDGGLIAINGGTILNQAAKMGQALAFVEAPAKISIDGTFIHNLNLIRPNADTPTAYFNGTGVGTIRNVTSFDGTAVPDRVSITSTALVDPSFEVSGWPDLIAINTDTQPITSRTNGTNIVLSKTTTAPRSGSTALSAAKSYGGGSPAAFILMMKAVNPGELLFSTFHYIINPSRTPVNSVFVARWVWAKLDRYDANGLPIFSATKPIYDITYTATDSYKMAVLGKFDEPGTVTPPGIIIGLSGRTVPPGYTHAYCEIDMFGTNQATINFDDLSIDSI